MFCIEYQWLISGRWILEWRPLCLRLHIHCTVLRVVLIKSNALQNQCIFPKISNHHLFKRSCLKMFATGLFRVVECRSEEGHTYCFLCHCCRIRSNKKDIIDHLTTSSHLVNYLVSLFWISNDKWSRTIILYHHASKRLQWTWKVFFSLKTSCVLDGNSSRESGGNDGRYQSQLSTSPITGQEGGATGGQRRAEGIPFPLK